MNSNKSEKIKNNEKKIEKKNGKTNGKAWIIAVCLMLAAGIFAFLLSVETKKMAQYDKDFVVIAISDVPANQEITEANVGTYFQVVERPVTDIPEKSFKDLNIFVGQYVQSGIDCGNIVTESMFGELKQKRDDIVLLALDMKALDQSVAGTLRVGDEIDIYTIEAELNEEPVVTKVMGNVSVERSYTNTGVAIMKEDAESVAQFVTIPIHKDAVSGFYTALEGNTVEIVKHP